MIEIILQFSKTSYGFNSHHFTTNKHRNFLEQYVPTLPSSEKVDES